MGNPEATTKWQGGSIEQRREGEKMENTANSTFLLEVLKFAVEMQGSVEEHRPHSEGSPQNTIIWMDWAQGVIDRIDNGLLKLV